MPGHLSEDDVRRLARLARLELTADEVRRFGAQLAEILDYANQVQQVDTATAPPASDQSAADLQPPREDRTRPGLSREEALSNAPDVDLDAGLFKVPRVLG